MEIFRSVTQTVLGSSQAGIQPSGADTVERLLDRVQSSTLLEDRRDGCRALKALSKKYRLLIGAHGMDTLIQVLETDRTDHEIVNYALETLANVTSDEAFPEEAEADADAAAIAKIGEQFCEIFVKRSENLVLVVSLLDEFDFKVRFPALKLLTNLLCSRPKEGQEVILATPNAVSRLMDLLADTREVIRNDTLLLLHHLTKGNASLQKIVVFENAFDLLFEVLEAEGGADGGVVVEDCLALMRTLLANNPSNQTLFKEGSYIARIAAFFELPLDSEAGWSAQKVANVHYMLKLVRTLVSPQSSGQLVSACQAKMGSGGLLARLCALLMAVGVPADILSDAIATVAEMIRGCRANQEYFAGVTAPSTPPRAAIVVLLMSLVNEKQPFTLRCAVLYCFQCFLHRNPDCQADVVRTLLPQTAQANEITAGQLLCGGLFGSDPVSNWFSAVALSHALLENGAQKEQLLRVQLATGAGSPPVSLLQQCATLLEAGSKILTRLGILQLLCTWLAHCPVAVAHLLRLPGVVAHLTAYVSAHEQDETEAVCQGASAFLVGLCALFNDGSVAAFTGDALAALVGQRVGGDAFAARLEALLRGEAYARAAKQPLLAARAPAEVALDHEFTRLIKELEGSVRRWVLPQERSGAEAAPAEAARYKDIIREQDAELTRLRQELDLLRERRALEAGRTSTAEAGEPDQVAHLQQQLTEMTYARDYYYYQMMEKDSALQQRAAAAAPSGEDPQMETLRKQLEDLQLALYRKDEQIQALQDTATQKEDVQAVRENVSKLESSVRRLEGEKADLEERLRHAHVALKGKEDLSPSQEEELARLQGDQEDLLVLLTDQETKITEMKRALRKYGETFSDDDDEDEEEDDDGLGPVHFEVGASTSDEDDEDLLS